MLHPLAPTDTPSVIGFLASQITLPNSTQVTENLNYFGDELSKGYVVSFENKNITQAMPTRELTLNSVNPKQWLNEDALPEIQVHYDNDGTARSYMVNHAALNCVFNPGQF